MSRWAADVVADMWDAGISGDELDSYLAQSTTIDRWDLLNYVTNFIIGVLKANYGR